MALLGFAIIFQFVPLPHLDGSPDFFHFIFTLLVGYILFPLFVLTLFIKLGWLPDIHLYDRRKRNLSYPVAIIGAIGIYFYMTQSSVLNRFLYSTYIAYWSTSIIFVLIIIWLINISGLKASAHAAGTSGFLGLCLSLLIHEGFAVPFILAGIIYVLVYISRLRLSAHSHIELIAGSLTGFLVTFAYIEISLQ